MGRLRTPCQGSRDEYMLNRKTSQSEYQENDTCEISDCEPDRDKLIRVNDQDY